RSLADHKIVDLGTVDLSIEPKPGKLRMTVAPKITVFAGNRNKLTVLIARHEFKEPVRLQVDGLPAGVDIPTVNIPADKTDATLEVDATRLSTKTPGAVHELRLRARANTTEEITASGKLQLKVDPHPGKLTMTVSPRVTVFPGDSNQFT